MAKRSNPPRQDTPEVPKITSKIEMVGREREIARLRDYLRARRSRNYVYWKAGGGLGKTRLLEELLACVRLAGDGYYSSGIIDLYHTDTHGRSDVEQLIVENVDQDHQQFQHYRARRAEYVRLRDLGASATELEERRVKLSELFTTEFNQMAEEAHKIVLIFDTVEYLQYESSLVEAEAGLDTVDTRLKPWLLTVLPKLLNVLVVFAGRPKLAAPGEHVDPQARLEEDFTRVFGADLEILDLQPLTLEETREFVARLPHGTAMLGESYLAVAHTLTGGRPIFIHLLVDLFNVLGQHQIEIRDLLDRCQPLVAAPADDPQLKVQREEFNQLLLDSIFNGPDVFGGYLGKIALMPKGVNRDILIESTGLPANEADALLAQLRTLSFVKLPGRLDATAGAPAQPHLDRLFLHDEMYNQLTSKVIRNLRLEERAAARHVVAGFYMPRIENLEGQMGRPLPPDKRIALRDELRKLQVERLYYYLVQDPQRGYAEYRALSDQANRDRQVGFSMRLLDEFLRFYNAPERQQQFEKAGITRERVIRENALLWLERFHWWARYERAILFGQRIIEAPEVFYIGPDDVALMGNVVALWARAWAIQHGCDETVLRRAVDALKAVRAAPPGADVEQARALKQARARLATSIGFLLDQGGELGAPESEDADYYAEAEATFRELDCCRDELAMLLNNIAYRSAARGQIMGARPRAQEALTMNRELHQRYSTGLSLTTLANIEHIDGNWREAEHHAEEAHAIFDELQDTRGRVLAMVAMAQAERKRAKYEIQKGRADEAARGLLDQAQAHLEGALRIAKDAGLRIELPIVLSKLGKVYRELGRLVTGLEGPLKGHSFYRKSEQAFKEALELPELTLLERFGMLVDYGEMLWALDLEAARKVLQQFEAEWTERLQGPALTPDLDLKAVRIEFCRPLGKYFRLKARIALREGDLKTALADFARAYACFHLFSRTTKDREALVELLSDELQPRPREQKRIVIEDLEQMAGRIVPAGSIEDLIDALSDLLSVRRKARG